MWAFLDFHFSRIWAAWVLSNIEKIGKKFPITLLNYRLYSKNHEFLIFFWFQLRMKETVSLYPFLLHAFFMSIFASVIGPFGGFFASGFKRAFKIKDFGMYKY